MKLRPCQAPDWRVTGARPARLATALASRRPSSGIRVSRPAAVMLDTPGIEVRISVRRANTISSANPLPIAASTAARCRSIWDSRVLLCCFSSGCRRCFWRFRAAVRSVTSASRATCSSSRARCAGGDASVGRRCNAVPICASTRASTASVLARCPIACAKRRACNGLARASGRPACRSASSKARCQGPVGSYTTERTGWSIHAISALNPAESLVNRAALPAGAMQASRCVFEMSTPTVQSGIFSFSCACLASLHAHVSIQDVGKDGGDQTHVRP